MSTLNRSLQLLRDGSLPRENPRFFVLAIGDVDRQRRGPGARR